MFFPKYSLTISSIFGILEDPPTNNTSSISFLSSFDTFKAFSMGGINSLNFCLQSSSKSGLVIVI